MLQKRHETAIEISIFEGLSLLRQALNSDQMLEFSKIGGFLRYRLLKIIDKEETSTMSTLLKLAVFLDFLDIHTLFKNLDERSRLLLTLYAVSGKGIEFFFDNAALRDRFTLYVRGTIKFQDKVRDAVDLAIDTCPKKLHDEILQVQEKLLPLKEAVGLYVAKHAYQKPPQSLLQVVESSTESVASQKKAEVVDGEGVVKVAKRFGVSLADMHDFVRHFLSDDIGPEGRNRLREIVGQEKIFALKNDLARLCSETAFKSIP